MEALESFTDAAAKNRNCLKDSSGSGGWQPADALPPTESHGGIRDTA